MATINEDGSPHNTPYFFMRDEALSKIYWGSHPESQHSLNILRSGQLFVVLFDSQQSGGLYIRAENGHALEGRELDEALSIHNEYRLKAGKPALPREYYTGDSPQRMWSADITQLWVNVSDRGEQGLIIKDYRREVTASDLTA